MMILADKIMEERKKLGLSQEELADQLGVSRQAVSKWESAQSIPDLQRVLALAELFGVSTDYLLREDVTETAPVSEASRAGDGSEQVKRTYGENTEKLHRVSMEEANDFLRFKRKEAPRVALGVALCILSPIVLIVLLGIAEAESAVSEALALGLGMAVLLCAVAAGVYLFISTGIEGRRYSPITEGRIDTAYGVTGMVKELRQSRESVYANSLTLGVIFCILSAVPLIVAAVMGAEDALILALVGLLLFFVAAGVYLIVRGAVEHSGYSALLEEGDFTPEGKAAQKTADNFGGIYWSIVTGIYLLWSFLSGDWGTTWLVWPVAGVLFGGISAVIHAVRK